MNGRSDMQAAVIPAIGAATGPRREKLLLHTTTAGRIKEGPYKTKLEQVEASLERNELPAGTAPHRTRRRCGAAIPLATRQAGKIPTT